MNCDEVEELIGAYVLGALPSESLSEIGEHLATCTNHPETAELQAVAGSLAFAAPEAEPSPLLKRRLMDAIRAPTAKPGQPPPRPGLAGWLGGIKLQRALPYALAGALAVAILALVVTNLPSAGDDRLAATFAGSGCSGGKLETRDEEIVVLDVKGLAPLGQDRVYQVWGIQLDTPESLGLLGNAPAGEVLGILRADLSRLDTIALTVEPAGGSAAPTSEPLCTADTRDSA